MGRVFQSAGRIRRRFAYLAYDRVVAALYRRRGGAPAQRASRSFGSVPYPDARAQCRDDQFQPGERHRVVSGGDPAGGGAGGCQQPPHLLPRGGSAHGEGSRVVEGVGSVLEGAAVLKITNNKLQMPNTYNVIPANAGIQNRKIKRTMAIDFCLFLFLVSWSRPGMTVR